MMLLSLTGLASQAAVLNHYTFDSDYTDSSGNGNDATLTDVGTLGNSGITTTTGESVFGGGAMEFSADSDYLGMTVQVLNGDYSISFWAQQEVTKAFNMVLGQRETNNSFIALLDADDLRWRGSAWVNTAPTSNNVNFDAEADTDWHHYVVVGEGTTMSLYLDGSPVSASTVSNTDFTVDTIGEGFFAGNGFDFEGRIDEVWILDEAADAATVSNLYATNTLDGVPEPGTVMFASVAVLLLARRRRN